MYKFKVLLIYKFLIDWNKVLYIEVSNIARLYAVFNKSFILQKH